MSSVIPPRAEKALDTFGLTLEATARLSRIFDRTLRDEAGMSQSWFEALLRIERSGGQMTMSELADQTVVTSGGITRLIDRLVEEGLVTREACPTDRRINYAAITEPGRERLGEAVSIHMTDLDNHVLSKLSDQERTTLETIMLRLRDGCSAGATD